MQEKLNWQLARFNKESGQFETESGVFLANRFLDALKFHPPGVAPVKDESGWYHIDAVGHALYSQRYERCFGYYEGKAAVRGTEGWTHVDLNGREQGSSYEWVGNYQEGRCVVRNFSGQYFHLDDIGQPAYANRYRYAGDFRDGLSCVFTEYGWTHIDRNGSMLHGRYFLGLNVFHKGFALALDVQGWFHIDDTGTAIYPNRFRILEPFYNGQALAQTDRGEWVRVSEEGLVFHFRNQVNSKPRF